MSRKRAQADAAPPADAPAREPVRFSGPYLIGDTGLQPPAGSFVRVVNSRLNDGLYEVQGADEEWLIVKPFVTDEAPSYATVTVEAVE